MNFQTIVIAFLFAMEIILFVITGMLLQAGSYGNSVIFLMGAMVTALYTGKAIEINAVEKYKEENE